DRRGPVLRIRLAPARAAGGGNPGQYSPQPVGYAGVGNCRPQGVNPLNATIKNLLLWMVILVLIILAWNVFKTGATAVEEISFSRFLTQVSQGHIQKVTIRGEEIRGTYSPAAGKRDAVFKTYAPSYPKL